MKKEKTHVSIVLDPEILQKLEEGNFNKSKLIDSLLDKYFKNREKINNSKK
jgi:hypothetical protein